MTQFTYTTYLGRRLDAIPLCAMNSEIAKAHGYITIKAVSFHMIAKIVAIIWKTTLVLSSNN